MTFTIMARCRDSGQSGIALATVSLAAGGLVGFYTPRGDIIATQAYARARLGQDILTRMLAGETGAAALAGAARSDPHITYRQVMILSPNGDTIAQTGPNCRSWAGHIIDGDLIVAGNVLAGRHVIEAMRDAWRASAGQGLGERLLRGLEAGRDAGGQATGDGAGLTERSAMVRVLEAGFPVLDLRVDVHPSAVHELRRIQVMHAVYADYAVLRDEDAPNTPSIVAYEQEKLKSGGVFAERPSCYR